MLADIVVIILKSLMLIGLCAVSFLLLLPLISKHKSINKLTKYVIECTDSVTSTQKLVITRTKALLEQHKGLCQIEVVAMDNGVDLVTNNAFFHTEIQNLIKKGVVFTVCLLSLQSLSQKIGHPFELTDNVKTVQDGHLHSEQLKENGYIEAMS
jgi:intracellular sulfur oxidation DsrE/DsrF family protein